MAGFERRGGVLLCDGTSLEEAAERYGTPLYLYSRALLTEAFEAYDTAFASVPHRICYALKANNSRALLRILCSLGAGADIVSGMELRAALRAGFPPERIVFSGVGKTQEELTLGIHHDIGCFNAESEDEIRHLSRLAVARQRVARVSLRVNPDIDAKSHPYVSTGLSENKFGVEIALAPEILRRARDLPGIAITGVQCHIGSQIRDLAPLEESTRELVRLARRLLDEGFSLTTIDIGGGLGVDYEGTGAPRPADLAARLLPLLAALPLGVLIEPGRSLVGPAGLLLSRVLYVKRTRGKTFLILDAGMNDLIRPTLYDAHHRIEPVRERGRSVARVDVVGPVCETGDFLARDRDIEVLEAGELVAIRDAGAYSFSMASTYNMRARPAEVLVEQGALRLIRRRETFEDLTSTEA